MRRLSFFLVILLALAFYSCDKFGTDPNLNDNLLLGFGESQTIDGTTAKIGFDTLMMDSRCPIDPLIYCVWAGMATIRVWVEQPGQGRISQQVSIPGFTDSTGNNYLPYVEVGNFKIRLRQLDPYPNTDSTTTPQDYRALIEVRENYPGDSTFVIRTDQYVTSFYSDELTVNSFSAEEDLVSVNVTHGGGCLEHDYFMYMSPKDLSTDNPPATASLYLQHLGYNDQCEALITTDLEFKMYGIIDAYRELYPDSLTGTVRLILLHFDGDEYIPEDTLLWTVPYPNIHI